MAKESKSQRDGFSLKPRKEMPEGLWIRCPDCDHMLYKKTVAENMEVCPECNYHFRIGAETRIQQLVDEGSFDELATDLISDDPLSFKFRDNTYKGRMSKARKEAKNNEAMRIGKAFIKGRGLMLAVMDFNFLGGSMGAVVGEKLCLAIDEAMDQSLPLVVVSSSGGARMHEGVVSVEQMSKTAASLARLDDTGRLFISILTDPTTGGVTASFAMLGDIIIAEPKALIGFAGPRVIRETIKVELPDGFQQSEFLKEHGFVDMIIDRKDLRQEIARLIDYCGK